MQIIIKVFRKLISYHFDCAQTGTPKLARPKYSKNKFAYLSNLQKNMRDKADFLPADKRESFLLVDSIILGMSSQACPKNPK